MDPLDADSRSRKERDETDASLRAERIKTDTELARSRTSVERDADDVVDVARDRAEATLRSARERADRGMAEAGAPPIVLREVEIERAVEDDAVSDEREVADEQLRLEREESQRALSALLRIERAATDDGLVVERARADEVVATRDDFLAMVSHDLRNMLGGIALSATLLAKHADADAEGGALISKHAQRIQRFTARMNHLVGDLLDVVSLEAGMLHVTLLPLDAVQLVEDVLEGLQPAFIAKGVKLTASIHDGKLVANGDRERIFQVLANLLGNALKFTDQGGSVLVSVARTASGVCFSVRDSGVGIPEGQVTAIFERFRQVSPKDRSGLGLGLYISKCIVEAHNGTIWAESLDAQGAALHFTLPESAG